ncbi:glycosyltransferase family 2 protein [Phormidesmis priestleyi ULC007]|uniref:Glycosyltransferase family 2 protein n=1 Tax=Phormidesmis priestleyi ULC007 TaxID=1920490 RepID=A0A2T1DK32_9CYAN|nr:glycosyltransferase family 2 protein [Phormidesmis priestleyi]PSB20859.1 glycosyltransferase family 2 protein [Phormidesmis priestleyi ULC007]PZO51814.1 MAG: glycosyltransferase family 2 protein [Phormidesmis priestleyi]
MTDSTVRINTGIPVYNSEGYLETALNLVFLAQPFSPFEGVIFDNTLTDRPTRLWAGRSHVPVIAQSRLRSS